VGVRQGGCGGVRMKGASGERVRVRARLTHAVALRHRMSSRRCPFLAAKTCFDAASKGSVGTSSRRQCSCTRVPWRQRAASWT
jgi:hypothetical protein